jgi:RNA polymerase sigma factor (sigma-70 family)
MVAASRAVVRSEEDAQDCAAEAIAQVLERQPENVAHLEAFMVTVATRRAIDQVRLRERSKRRDARLATESIRITADVADDVATKAEASWANQQARDLLQPRVYQLLKLLAQGTSMQRASAELGMTERAAESHLLRARRTLRAALAKTLCGLGAVVAYLKRSSLPTAAVTVAVVAVLAVTLPHVDGQLPLPGALPDTPRQSSAPAFGMERSTAMQRDQVSLSRPAPAPARRVGAPVAPRTGARPGADVQTPVAGVEVQHKSDEHQSQTFVDRVRYCVEHLRVELHYQGCDTSGT